MPVKKRKKKINHQFGGNRSYIPIINGKTFIHSLKYSCRMKGYLRFFAWHNFYEELSTIFPATQHKKNHLFVAIHCMFSTDDGKYDIFFDFGFCVSNALIDRRLILICYTNYTIQFTFFTTSHTEQMICHLCSIIGHGPLFVNLFNLNRICNSLWSWHRRKEV